MADRRSRSRSPPRKAPKGSGGFRWKDSRSQNRDSRDSRDGRDGRDTRDSRDRYGAKEFRDRSPQRDRGGYSRDYNRRDDGPPRRDGDRDRSSRDRDDRRDEPKKDKKDKDRKAKKAAPIAPGQEMIVVNVNDRLGTKTAIPCLPSDTIGQLKLMIAARIGRESSQIMLRRQGERPFKDQLTLDDYGISNGVQLDLEVDTGD